MNFGTRPFQCGGSCRLLVSSGISRSISSLYTKQPCHSTYLKDLCNVECNAKLSPKWIFRTLFLLVQHCHDDEDDAVVSSYWENCSDNDGIDQRGQLCRHNHQHSLQYPFYSAQKAQNGLLGPTAYRGWTSHIESASSQGPSATTRWH
jgi:hypothetical protein